jgi:hypothetical protein
MAVTTDRVRESLNRLTHYVESDMYTSGGEKTARAEASDAGPITIALSREAGSRGAEIARAVGAHLNWPVYDHELLDRIAEEKRLSKRLLEHLDEHYVGWLEEAVRSFCTPEGSREGSYLRGLLGLLASLGRAGHCIIVGRGAAQVLPPETIMSVRVVAPRRDRIAAVEKRAGLSAAEAERWVDTHDRERLRFVKEHFHVDAADPVTYDLVLNSRRMSTDECAALIVQAARALEAHPMAK